MFSHKKCLVTKKFYKKFFLSQIFLVTKKSQSQKNLSHKKNLGTKFFQSYKNFSHKKILVTKNFSDKKF